MGPRPVDGPGRAAGPGRRAARPVQDTTVGPGEAVLETWAKAYFCRPHKGITI